MAINHHEESQMSVRHLRSLTAAVAVATIVACAQDGATSPEHSPLAGLNKAGTVDTSNSTHVPTGEGPGFYRGTVVGQWDYAAGVDSTKAAPRLAGVVVTIYLRNEITGQIGEAKGSVTTAADGAFKLPLLPAGHYAVTFVPPENSGYYGVYAFGDLRENSSEFPWWVVLSKK
jgi:hypothetical protein